MGGNSVYRLRNTSVLSVAALEAPEVVSSAQFDELLAPTLQRLGLRSGMLQQVAGIQDRRWWPEGVTYSECAAQAGAKAIEAAGISPDQIGLLIDTSVSRARLEPSSAVFVHNQLDLPSSCLNFDLSNACLGFVNGMQLAGTMIDAGHIDYALIVDAEGSRLLQQRTIERLQGPDTTVADVLSEFAALTLGSGAAGMVLGRSDRHPDGHRFVNVVSRAATEHHDLCLGDMDRMITDSRAMLLAGLEVAEIAMKEALLEFDWLDLQHYIVHQVSTVHCDMLVQRLGLDPSRVPITFPAMGNMGPAAIPITLALHQDNIVVGDRILMMGMGSGINAMAAEIVW